jgi:hypothetical protein
MSILLAISQGVAVLLPWAVVGGLICAAVAVTLDVRGRRFKYSKWALLALLAIVLIEFANVALVYRLTSALQ